MFVSSKTHFRQDKKSALKRLKPAPTRDVSQNLSVHLNSSKRLVMEKIQIELNTVDNMDVEGPEPAPCKFYLFKNMLACERVT